MTILGSGTSTGVPPIGCRDPRFLNGDPKNQRLRAGVLIREPDKSVDEALSFIIDCGPDYRQQALRHSINRLDGVLITHTHFDHVGGMDDLRLYNFMQGHDLPVYGQQNSLDEIQARYPYIFNPPTQGGGVASFELKAIEDEAFDFHGFRVQPIPVFHGSLPIIGFRFGDFSFITDASKIPEESMDLISGSRVLVLNALRPQPHTTHFSLDEAVEVAQMVNAEQTYFIHMTHLLEHHSTNAELPDGIQLSYDGLEFDVNIPTL